MFNHYLAVALRHFRRHKTTTGVNVACLGLGLTCFIVAWGTTAYFGRTDSYRPNAARTFIVITGEISSSDPVIPVGPPKLAENLAADFPQLDAVARATPTREVPVSIDNPSRFAKIVYADPQFLGMFDLPLLQAATNDTKTLLSDAHTAIISRNMARRLFGTDQVVGRTFRVGDLKEGGQSVTITGVVGSIRQRSQMTTDTAKPARPFSLQFDALVSMDMDPARDAPQTWTSRGYFTYVMLPRDGSFTAAELNDQLKGFAKRHVPSDRVGGALEFHARPISDITQISLDSLVGANRTGVSSTTVVMMLGGLVLLVACFNYANLASAQSLARAREIAVRRVLGAKRSQIVVQHVVEGFLLTGCALLVSLLCIAAMLFVVGAPTLAAVVRMFAPTSGFWSFLAALVVLVTLMASAYPALLLCGVRPSSAPQGVRITNGWRFFPTLLVALQFAFAGFLLIAVFVMAAQNRAMERAIGNPSGDPIVVIANDIGAAGIDKELLKTELLEQPGISAVGGIDFIPWGSSFTFTALSSSPAASAARVRASREIVDPDIFGAMGIRFLAGRNFDNRRAADSADVEAWRQSDSAAAMDFNVVIDRSMVRRIGLASPEEAIGKLIYRPTSRNSSTPPQRLHVIGVVEDAVIQPVSLGAPSFYLMNAKAAAVPVIRVSKDNVAAALAGIDEVWSKLAPDVPFERRFAEEQYEASYGALNVVDKVFAALGAFASVIATMGLIGMALHIMRRRTKEIAVRKVMGARVGQILWMLLRRFSKPIVIANLAVWPLAYLVMRGYLSLFAVRSGLGLIPFATSLLITLLLAWAAIAMQALRAARTSPATVLRCE